MKSFFINLLLLAIFGGLAYAALYFTGNVDTFISIVLDMKKMLVETILDFKSVWLK